MISKEQIEEKINEKFSIRKLAEYFNKSNSAIRYLLNKYKLNTSGYVISNNWDKEKLLEAIKKSECKSDILKNLNIKIKSGNFQTLERYCIKYNLDLSKLKYKNNRGFKFERTIENKDIFILNSHVSGTTARRRIKKDGLLKYECEKCTNTGEWQGQKLSLQLDHINGINNDHRLENLRFLCPNCHAQTTTFNKKNPIIKQNIKCIQCENLIKVRANEIKTGLCSKCYNNQKSITSKITNDRNKLLEEVKMFGYVKTGQLYGVSNNAVKNRIKKLFKLKNTKEINNLLKT